MLGRGVFAGIFMWLLCGSASADVITKWPEINMWTLQYDVYGYRETAGGNAESEYIDSMVGWIHYLPGTNRISKFAAASPTSSLAFISEWTEYAADVEFWPNTDTTAYGSAFNVPVYNYRTDTKLLFSFAEIAAQHTSGKAPTLDSDLTNVYAFITDAPGYSWVSDLGYDSLQLYGSFRQLGSAYVPEPASIGLMSLAVLGLAAARRRQKISV